MLPCLRNHENTSITIHILQDKDFDVVYQKINGNSKYLIILYYVNKIEGTYYLIRGIPKSQEKHPVQNDIFHTKSSHP